MDYCSKKHFFHDGNSKNLYNISLHIDNTPCDYAQYSLLKSSALYFHGFFEIMLIQCKEIRMQINEKCYLLKENDLVVFSPQDFHRFILEKGQVYKRWSCEFSPEYIRPFFTQDKYILHCFTKEKKTYCHVRHLDNTTANHLIDTFSILQKKESCTEYGNDITIKCIFSKLLLQINRLFDIIPPCDDGEIVSTYHKMRLILDYINHNLSSVLTLDTLSKRFYISKYHLCRVFKKTLGYTVNEYITYQRVINAAALLRNGYSVSQACEAVTPEGESHFIAVFKKLIGTTPKQYAKKYQEY